MAHWLSQSLKHVVFLRFSTRQNCSPRLSSGCHDLSDEVGPREFSMLCLAVSPLGRPVNRQIARTTFPGRGRGSSS
jgi:hypothetical protein